MKQDPESPLDCRAGSQPRRRAMNRNAAAVLQPHAIPVAPAEEGEEWR